MPDEPRSTHLVCGRKHVRRDQRDDEAIGQLASRQRGVVSRRQLLELAISPRALEHRLAEGRLRKLYSGVYAVGHIALAPVGWACAGVLATGLRSRTVPSPVSRASFHTAAMLLELGQSKSESVHVTTERELKGQSRLVVHQAVLPPDELTVVRGVPATTASRTLLDLSGVLAPRVLRRMVKRAEFNGQASFSSLRVLLARYPRRRGRRALASLLPDEGTVGSKTRSDLEDEFLTFCRRAGLPQPETNVRFELGGLAIEVDCIWRDSKLAVELDGWQAHRGRLSFEDDRARDRALTVDGWTVTRITSAQLEKPRPLAEELRSLLNR